MYRDFCLVAGDLLHFFFLRCIKTPSLEPAMKLEQSFEAEYWNLGLDGLL